MEELCGTDVDRRVCIQARGINGEILRRRRNPIAAEASVGGERGTVRRSRRRLEGKEKRDVLSMGSSHPRMSQMG